MECGVGGENTYVGGERSMGRERDGDTERGGTPEYACITVACRVCSALYVCIYVYTDAWSVLVGV